MSTIYSDNTVMVEMIHTHASNRVENVYHVLCPGVPTAADLNNIFGVFNNWERNIARAQRSSATAWAAYSLLSIHNPGQPFLQGAVTPAFVAGAIGQPSFPNVTLAIRFGTGLSGRSYRGRAYWVGMPYGGVNTDGLMTAGYVTLLVAVYENLRAALATAGYTFVVCSKYSGVDYSSGRRRAIPRARGITTPITSINADNYIDSQRRRLIRPTT